MEIRETVQKRLNMIRKAAKLEDCQPKGAAHDPLVKKRQQKQSCTLVGVMCFDRDGN